MIPSLCPARLPRLALALALVLVGAPVFAGETPGDHEQTLAVGGVTRRFLLHVPKGFDAKRVIPLVFLFHGGGGRAAGILKTSRFRELADRHGFLLAVPEGMPRDPARAAGFRTNPQTWNDGSGREHVASARRKIDDVGFVRALLTHLERRFPIDARRIYATGFSNGASMAYRVGRALKDRIAAIAPVAGADWGQEPLPADLPALLYVTGLADPLNPFEGGSVRIGRRSFGKKEPVSKQIEAWRKALGCAETPRTLRDEDGIKILSWAAADARGEVRLATIAGHGHVWPGATSGLPESIVGPTAAAATKYAASRAIWTFFVDHPRRGATELKVLSGQPRLVVVHGYSTSFAWPRILQRKLDRQFGGKRVVEVRQATRGGAPIARWIDVDTGLPKPLWDQIVRPALAARGDRPAVVLAQQSLQWAFGRRRAGIRGKHDKQRIRRGADVLQRYVRLLHEAGADLVFVATHIYKQPMEPAIGNERFALAELVRRKLPGFRAGPDVWESTRKQYPGAFARDGIHPNSIGAEIMAQLWFQTLLKHDGLKIPAWSREEMERAIRRD